MTWLKLWFNANYPTHRVCLHPWCLRGQTYQYRCWLHNRD